MNLSNASKAAARRHANRTAFIGPSGERLSYRAFDARVDHLATWLARRYATGSRICVMMKNSIEAALLHFAIARAGLVRVPLNVRYTSLEMQKVVDSCGARALFFDRAARVPAEEARSGMAGGQCEFHEADAHSGCWEEALRTPVAPELLHRSGLDDLASITYTSGTTGSPKGVVLSHRNWIEVHKNLLIDRDLRSDDLVVHISPFSHAAAAYLEAWFLRGACCLIVDATVEALIDASRVHAITAFTCVPTFLTKLVNSAALGTARFDHLRIVSYGGEPISSDTLEKSWRALGPVLWQNYGQTEAMVTCAHMSPADHLDAHGQLRKGYIGKPYTYVDLIVRDPATGHEVPAGQPGELTIRGAHVMHGYWEREEDTRKAVRNGWLWTGDTAMKDEDGFVRLVGRSKDMLICGGFNIYPADVEQALTSHSHIVEAAVIATGDSLWGQIPVAAVVLNPASASGPRNAQELTEFFKPLLGIKTPKRWLLVPELPKTSIGKIDKTAVARWVAEGETA